MARVIYCHETKERFSSIRKAAEKYNVNPAGLQLIIDNPDRTVKGYHWCSDLSVFDGADLREGQKGKSVYCYEKREMFESIAKAASDYGTRASDIHRALNNLNRTAAGFHWCTDLSIFDGKVVTSGSEGSFSTIYCHETKEKFPSFREASRRSGQKGLSSFILCLNNPNKTAAGFHWCTDLSIFDGKELVYPNSGTSVKEKKLVDFVKSIYKDEIIENSRKVIPPQELDMLIPQKNLAVEFNGNYWHSENYKDKDYHINKTNLCRGKGIQLIHIFEHQWDSKSEIFKSVISNKLGLSQKIYARKCKVVELDSVSTNSFLDENHLQGRCNSSIRLGLTYNDELASVMTFGKPRFDSNHEFELLRFCNKLNTTVIGGASKLLKYFKSIYSPTSIISYANLQWSDGKVYENLGFTNIGTSSPNYWWIKGELVLTRYQCQKHKLGVLLGDDFNPSLSEKENMEVNGYFKVNDCGNLVFSWRRFN